MAGAIGNDTGLFDKIERQLVPLHRGFDGLAGQQLLGGPASGLGKDQSAWNGPPRAAVTTSLI